jgi:small-conductance mechanosensitive channel
MGVDPQIGVAIATVLAAIAAGFFSWRAAGKTAQPSAQDAINSGFTALTARQVEELRELRTDLNRLEKRVEAQDETERRLQQVIRLLLSHLENLRRMLTEAGLVVPPDPVDARTISKLLDKSLVE